MENITSRKNRLIRHYRALAADGEYRREQGEFLCEGEKLLGEALAAGAEIRSVLYRGREDGPEIPGAAMYCAPEELFSYASPLENSPGPLFAVAIPRDGGRSAPDRVLILENVQDPGNVGTVLRTAAALGTDLVVLTGACADPYNPKTVRATMGAVFRQPLARWGREELTGRLKDWALPLYGAALGPGAERIGDVCLARAAVAVGNEGRGLTPELLALCRGRVVIPMAPGNESLNAAVAAAIFMWEMAKAGQRE